MAAAIRTSQRGFVTHFPRGRPIRRDVSHFMEPVIPQVIADEVERVIARR